MHGVIAQLAEPGATAEMALALYLEAALAASDVANLELMAYEFFEQVHSLCPSRLQGFQLRSPQMLLVGRCPFVCALTSMCT